MAQKVNQGNIKVEPVYVQWSRPQLTKVKTIADVAGALGGKHFLINDGLNAGYYVWMNTGADVDPAVAGRTEIEVAITANMTAAQIATAVATALNSSGFFFAKSIPGISNELHILTKEYGLATVATAATSGFTVSTPRLGQEIQLGYMDGDVEPGFTEDLLDVTAHQTGTQILQAIRTGRNLENIAISLKESDVEKLKSFILASGSSLTPPGVGVTVVVGWGTEEFKMFYAVLDDCARLVFHPIRKADNDYVEDMTFMAAYPLLSGIVFSGENTKMINLEFKILPDGILTEEVRVFALGNHEQNLLDA